MKGNVANTMTEYEQSIRLAMAKKGIRTYSELAALLGVSVSYVSDVVHYNRKATDLRQKINDFLELEGD